MAFDETKLRYYLTSVEPAIAQTIHSQSIGGYQSTSLLYPQATLSADVSMYDETKIDISTSTGFTGNDFVYINGEMIEVNTINSSSLTVVDRGYKTKNEFHQSGNRVLSIARNSLFNESFNDDKKQYRCLAIKNNDTVSIYNVEAYVRRQPYYSSSTMRLAVEIPLADYISGTATSGEAGQLVDTSIEDMFPDDYFKDCRIAITIGSTKYYSIVNTFDNATGTFVFYSSIATDISAGDTYTVDPSPSSRVSSGIVKPSDTSLISDFFKDEKVAFNVGSQRDHGNEFKPNDVFYIWIERTLSVGTPFIPDNLSLITLRYSRTA